ncbi:MAG: hypothetical protein CUN55_09040 [Phototrophicales bacterium]|nr:MAG: hypothetical protein CUN55_09040 [Phototrophicales bacterium]
MQEIADGVLIETELRGVTLGAIRTEDGFVLIDTPTFPTDAALWRKTLQSYADLPILAIIMLDSHRDRLLGASWFNPNILIAHRLTLDIVSSLSNSYVSTIANLSATNAVERARLMNGKILHPTITFSDTLRLHFGDLVIHLQHRPGPTSGSIWVYLEKEEIVFVGDSLVVNTPPYLASPYSQAWLSALNELEDRWPNAQIVTGRGALAKIEDAWPLRTYLKLARDNVKTLYENRRPLSEITALITQLQAIYPPPHEYELDEIQQRIRTGLQFIYNEFREADLKTQQALFTRYDRI